MWKKNAHVIIVDFVYHKKNDIKSKGFRFAKIVEVGKDDLLVTPKRTWSYNKLLVVPKASCVLIDEATLNPHAAPREPNIGDLVCAFTQNFSGKSEYKIVHVYEKKYSPGNPIEYLVKIGDSEDWYQSDRLLVIEGDKHARPSGRDK